MRGVSERGWVEEWRGVWRCGGACAEHWPRWTTCLCSSLNGLDGRRADLPLVRLLSHSPSQQRLQNGCDGCFVCFKGSGQRKESAVVEEVHDDDASRWVAW